MEIVFTEISILQKVAELRNLCATEIGSYTVLIVILASILLLFSILERLEELNYRRVTLTGYFDHSREAHVWPLNQLVTIPTLDSSNESGAQIITPFYCYETESVINS